MVVADRLRKVLRVVITADLAARPSIERGDDVPLAARTEFLVGAHACFPVRDISNGPLYCDSPDGHSLIGGSLNPEPT